MTPKERARAIIENGQHMTIATSDESGTPWVSPLFYVADENYDLYWVSAKAALHSANIRNRPAVAVVIFQTDPEVDAAYLPAEAVELNDDHDVRRGVEIMGRKTQPDKFTIEAIADVTGSGPWRVYKAVPKTIDVRAEAVESGKCVTVREPADFRSHPLND